MLIKAQEDEAVRALGAQVGDHQLGHRPAVNRNQRLGQGVADVAKARAAPRHRQHDIQPPTHDLVGSLRYLSLGAPGHFTTTVVTGPSVRKSASSPGSSTMMSPGPNV